MENFEGLQPRECGEHRTVGPHRAWCYECGEWCYPRTEGACRGCRLPALTAENERLRAQRDEAVALLTRPFVLWRSGCGCCTANRGRTAAVLAALSPESKEQQR